MQVSMFHWWIYKVSTEFLLTKLTENSISDIALMDFTQGVPKTAPQNIMCTPRALIATHNSLFDLLVTDLVYYVLFIFSFFFYFFFFLSFNSKQTMIKYIYIYIEMDYVVVIYQCSNFEESDTWHMLRFTFIIK